MAADDDDLLAAYVDGVAELTPEERKRIEGKLGELDVAGTREVIDLLRALPPEGNEPDWRAMQTRIAKAIDETPRPWWRRWFVPAFGLAVVAGAALLLLTVRHDEPAPAVQAPVAVQTPVPDAAVPAPPAQATELWLDGQLVDVSDVDPEALFDDLDEPDAVADDGELLTVDQLDDKALDNLDRWLEGKKS